MTTFESRSLRAPGLLLFLGILMSSTAAHAQGTAEQRSACMGDAFRFCSAYIPDVAQIESCLVQNRSSLSPACAAEFQPASRTRLRHEHFRQ